MNYPFYQEKIFSKEECDAIINFSKIYKASKERRVLEPKIDFETNRVEDIFRVSEDNKKYGKSFFVYDIIREEETEWLFVKLLNWFSERSNIKLSEENILRNITLLNYKTGDFFMRHQDINEVFKLRRWTINIQLGDSYKGGDYILYNNNDAIILGKEVGNTIAYWAGTEHEIKEITEGERWSVVCSVSKHMILEENKKII